MPYPTSISPFSLGIPLNPIPPTNVPRQTHETFIKNYDILKKNSRSNHNEGYFKKT